MQNHGFQTYLLVQAKHYSSRILNPEKKINLLINHGDILAISTPSQNRIKHKVLEGPKNDLTYPRVSLTFRQIN